MIAPAIGYTKILVCDNQLETRTHLGQVLMDAGYQPLIAKNMDEVVPLIESENPKLLLLEVTESNENVFQVASYLRQSGMEIPMFFMTSNHDTLSCVYSMVVGAAGYFRKPIDTEELLCRIEDVIA